MDMEPGTDGFWLLGTVFFLIFVILSLLTCIICWLVRRHPREATAAGMPVSGQQTETHQLGGQTFND
jgi:heme/copper-type cytochrome/quinol oxidase subunit 2